MSVARIFVLASMFVVAIAGIAQEKTANASPVSSFPDAPQSHLFPTPAQPFHWVAAPKQKKLTRPWRFEQKTFKGLEIALPAALIFDMVFTKKTIDHPRSVSFMATRCETSINGGASFYFECPTPIPMTWSLDKVYFAEGGWAKHVVDPNSSAKVIAANVLLDVAVWGGARLLRHWGHTGKILSDGVLTWKTTGHIIGGIGNIRHIRAIERNFPDPTDGVINVVWH